MGEIFLVGIVIIIVLVILNNFLTAYDEWKNGNDES